MLIKYIFWISFALIVYTYIGYGIIVFLILTIKRLFGKKRMNHTKDDDFGKPDVTLFVAAYNEKDYIDEKVKNSLALDYPKEKLFHIWVTDGSDDGTPEMLKKYPEIQVYHKNERAGKIGAINRGMKFVKTPIVIFSDGNTMLSKSTVKEIVRLFQNPTVGCVSGEKNIELEKDNTASVAGEGSYWKYESVLKKMDAELYSAVGAVGELFAIRTNLFEEVEKDTLLDDFMISMRIVQRGYRIQYSSKAKATEKASANIKEELKRKVRIAAGSMQSLIRLKSLLNPFKTGIFTFQYISRKVLRWFVLPLLLPLLFITNAIIVFQNGNQLSFTIYEFAFIVQILFYIISVLGKLFEHKKVSGNYFFVPYYICMINYAAILGVFRYFYGKQSVNWERAKRSR